MYLIVSNLHWCHQSCYSFGLACMLLFFFFFLKRILFSKASVGLNIQYFGHGVRCKVFSVLCSTWILKFFMFESMSGSGAVSAQEFKKRKKGSLDHSSAATCTAVILRTASLWHGLMSSVVSSPLRFISKPYHIIHSCEQHTGPLWSVWRWWTVEPQH